MANKTNKRKQGFSRQFERLFMTVVPSVIAIFACALAPYVLGVFVPIYLWVIFGMIIAVGSIVSVPMQDLKWFSSYIAGALIAVSWVSNLGWFLMATAIWLAIIIRLLYTAYHEKRGWTHD